MVGDERLGFTIEAAAASSGHYCERRTLWDTSQVGIGPLEVVTSVSRSPQLEVLVLAQVANETAIPKEEWLILCMEGRCPWLCLQKVNLRNFFKAGKRAQPS